MGLKTIGVFLLAASAAFPQARLRLSQTTVGPISVAASGSNTQIVEASNAGTGALNLTVTSNQPWVTTSVGSPRSCAGASGACVPISIVLRPAGLSAGLQYARLVVSDPGAWDAPQTIDVIAAVDGGVPASLSLHAAPGGTATATFTTNSAASATSNVPWMTVALTGGGTFDFIRRFTATATGPATPGTYNGALAVSGATLSVENRSVPVQLTVTTAPIARVSPERLDARFPQAFPAETFFSVSNGGQGTLTLSGITASSARPGWLSASILGGPFCRVQFNPTGLAPGVYTGSVSVTGNFVNSPVTITVTYEVIAENRPLINFNGALNNANFAVGEDLARGGLVALFGQQLRLAAGITAPAGPWPDTVGTTRVFVSGQSAPIYYADYSQIVFQIPFDANLGPASIQVLRDGVAGNAISATIREAQPRIMEWGFTRYAIAVNANGTLPLPPAVRQGNFQSVPASPGDTLVFYALGLGQTTPSVTSGGLSPSSPLAIVPGAHSVQFTTSSGPVGGFVSATPFFVGLTPGFVGLYQVNVTIPADAPRGNQVFVTMTINGQQSNRAAIAIQ